LIGFLHTLCVLSLSIYGVQAILLTLLYLRHRGDVLVGCDPDELDWPLVAIQLPIYNELHVVERLIDAAAALDYPAGKLEVQVLDDSTDDTTQLAEARATYHRARGINVRVLRRPTREGFKAGALAWGLKRTAAEFLAVFDADFSPRPDFLRRTIPQLIARPQVGVVQTRWSHLNEVYSPLTRLQALALNGHFVVEQTGRAPRYGAAGEFSWSGAYHTTYWADPAEKLVVVFMSQLLPAGTVNLTGRVRTLVNQAIVGPPTGVPAPPSSAPAKKTPVRTGGR